MNDYINFLLEAFPIKEKESSNKKLTKEIKNKISKTVLDEDLSSFFKIVKEENLHLSIPLTIRFVYNLYLKDEVLFNQLTKETLKPITSYFKNWQKKDKGDFFNQFLLFNKETRQFGNTFKDWLSSLDQFKNFHQLDFDTDENFITTASDQTLKEFANKQLGLKLEKGYDALIKRGNQFYLIEAKFITSDGGSQNHQFKDAISVANIKKKNVQGIAIIDGSPQLNISHLKYQKEMKENPFIFNLLEFKNFLDKIFKEITDDQ